MHAKIRPGTKISFLTDMLIPSLLNIEIAYNIPANTANEYDTGSIQ